MDCVDKMPQDNMESEMEEGEIVDELDDLSDISSEEEFLLRQRLEVLESYNNVLERTKAKRSSMGPCPKRDIVCNLSTISGNALKHTHVIDYKHNIKVQRHVKPHHVKQKRKKDTHMIHENNVRKRKDHKKKTVHSKKKQSVIVLNESSDESDDEYRNKRRKLADAVVVPKTKNDKTSLSARLFKMMRNTVIPEVSLVNKEESLKTSCQIIFKEDRYSPISSVNTDDLVPTDDTDGVSKAQTKICSDPIELSTDDDVKIVGYDVGIIQDNENDNHMVEEEIKESNENLEKDSDDDLELLRQHALESKPCKAKAAEPAEAAVLTEAVEPADVGEHAEAAEPIKTNHKILLEDEDSDITELRLICLKSAWLKKVIEMKQKQKRQKKLSTSNLKEDLFENEYLFANKENSDNNTDIESVDMEMGSDIEEKFKDCVNENDKVNNMGLNLRLNESTKNDLINCAINNLNASSKEDELDEDEDLLRAKLLTSLSKNLTNLVNPKILNTINDVKNVDNSLHQNVVNVNMPEEKTRFIIKVGESDSEGEHEATKNLTKMHIKLAEQIDFQQKLDMFLKSTRNQVEMSDKLPDIVQKSPLVKKPDKFVAKTVKHLPKSEQIEYKNLVRRMEELEKIKLSRQAVINRINQPFPSKDTLKPRNVFMESQPEINNNLEEQIAKSRKKIAEESAAILKLKEEATKLSQKYKIAATELRNIGTAIAFNKKQQRSIQINLSKIRLQHQLLLKNSTSSIHSNVNARVPYSSNFSKVPSNKLQKENNPRDNYSNPNMQKAFKVSVVNDFVSEHVMDAPKLSVQVDVTNSKKVVKMSTESSVNDRIVEMEEVEQPQEEQLPEISNQLSSAEVDKGGLANNAELVAVCDHGNKRYYISEDDYKSPLDALGTTNWKEDPNAILCPFEVQGQCKDVDCKYLHTTHSEQ